MKFLFLLIILFCVTINLKAQNVSKVSAPYSAPKFKDTYQNNEFITTSDGLFMIKSSKAKVYFQKVNPKTLKVTTLKEESVPKNTIQLEKVVSMGNRHYAFYTSFDKAAKSVNCNIVEIDIEKGGFKNNSQIIHGGAISAGETKNLIVRNIYHDVFLSRFDIIPSFDNSKVLVIAKESKKTELFFNIFNEDLQKVVSKKIQLPFSNALKSSSIEILDYQINSNNDIFLTVKEYSKSTHSVYVIKAGSDDEIIKSKIEKSGKKIEGAWLKQVDDKKVKCIVAYSSSEKANSADGLFISDVEADCTLKNEQLQKLPLSSYMSSVDFFAASYNEGITKKDGSSIFVFEPVEFTYYNSERGMNFFHNYIVKISKDGEIEWINNLPKIHKTNSALASCSYKYLSTEDFHYIFCMDNSKNPETYNTEIKPKHFSYKNGNLIVYKVEHETGKVSKHTIIENNKVNGKKLPYLGNFFICKTSKISANKAALELMYSNKENIIVEIALP